MAILPTFLGFFDISIVLLNTYNWFWYLMLYSIAMVLSDKKRPFVFPSMYDNIVSQIVFASKDEKGNLLGPFKYYDLFSWWGMAQYFGDKFLIVFMPLLAGLILLI